jgi:hypothetical protein
MVKVLVFFTVHFIDLVYACDLLKCLRPTLDPLCRLLLVDQKDLIDDAALHNFLYMSFY